MAQWPSYEMYHPNRRLQNVAFAPRDYYYPRISMPSYNPGPRRFSRSSDRFSDRYNRSSDRLIIDNTTNSYINDDIEPDYSDVPDTKRGIREKLGSINRYALIAGLVAVLLVIAVIAAAVTVILWYQGEAGDAHSGADQNGGTGHGLSQQAYTGTGYPPTYNPAAGQTAPGDGGQINPRGGEGLTYPVGGGEGTEPTGRGAETGTPGPVPTQDPSVTVPLPTATLLENQCALLQGTTCTDIEGFWCLNNGTLLCKADQDGWITWLRRVDGLVQFNRPWDEYVSGFGDARNSYWLGLEKLHQLTGTGTQFVMRVDVTSFSDVSEYAEYDTFSVGPSDDKYRLLVRGFSGTLTENAINHEGNDLYMNSGMAFSTVDQDNDRHPTGSCVQNYGGGGWWYNWCGETHPTDVYGCAACANSPYIWWAGAFGSWINPVKTLSMKVRPVLQATTTTDPETSTTLYQSLRVNQCVELTGQTACTQTTGYLCLDSGKLLCRTAEDGTLDWLRRVDDTVSFRNLEIEYLAGFGDPSGNYWLGLQFLNKLTNDAELAFKLRVELESWSGATEYAEYTTFTVGDVGDKYQLTVSGFSGTTPTDALDPADPDLRLSGLGFSSVDNDVDNNAGASCVAGRGGGGWWMNNCAATFPTDQYGTETDKGAPYMWWADAFGEYQHPIKSLIMKLVPGAA